MIRYLSLCSGIEAFSCAVHDMPEFVPVAFAEIEPFPCRVLQHHYPDVPNLGDITKIDGSKYAGKVDLIVGGTPCQQFSVAGNRTGLRGAESSLAYHYIRLLNEVQPKYFIWENVPGCLSTGVNKGDDFKFIMESFQDAGYILDVDILDAQFFGVPQRRRRVFVCGFHADLLKKKTNFSVSITLKCLLEILQNILIELLSKSGNVQTSFISQDHLSDGLKKKTIWLLKHGTIMEDWTSLLNDLKEDCLKLVQGQENLEYQNGDINLSGLQEGSLMDLLMGFLSGLTGESLKKSWDESLHLLKSFTILTETKTTISQTIYIFSQAVLNMQKLIYPLLLCCQTFLAKGLSNSTALQDYMKYARRTTESLLGDWEHRDYWCDFIRQAEYTDNLVGHLGDWRSAAEVLFEFQSLCGNPAPRRKTGKDVAAEAGTGSKSRSHWEGGPHPCLCRLEGAGGFGFSNQEIFSQRGAMLVPSRERERDGRNADTGIRQTRQHMQRCCDGRTAYTKQALGEYKQCGVASTLSRRDYKDATDLVVDDADA